MRKTEDLSRFWDNLRQTENPVLMLDYDGTLAPFTVQRDQAVPYPGVRQLLEAIETGTDTRLIIVSGRAVDDLRPLLGLEHPPEIWGCHGWEHRLPDGHQYLIDFPPEAQKALTEARRWALERELGDQFEEKPVSVAVHWRGLPPRQIETLRTETTEAWTPLAERADLELHLFDGGIELRCPGRDKGSAVDHILQETAPNAAIAYLGDDLTDEQAFAALGNHGLSVLVRTETRPTAADCWLRPPEELRDFLRHWLSIRSGKEVHIDET